MFTRSSVHCAERIVAMRSSNGFEYTSAGLTFGYSFFRISKIFTAYSFSIFISHLYYISDE